MANKNYHSANNRTIDIDTLRLKNENVRAVGNMGVNARGDKLDNNNKTVDTKNRRISRQYKKQTNVVDQPVADSIADAKKKADLSEQTYETDRTEREITDNFQSSMTSLEAEDLSKVDADQQEDTNEPRGLAAAIARTREVKQEEIVPPRKAAQQKPGVKKI